MKNKTSILVLSSALALAPAASASLLVGFHDSTGGTNFIINSDWSGSFATGSTPDAGSGGSNDGFYGKSGLPSGGSLPPNDGYYRTLFGSVQYHFSLDGNASGPQELGGFLFDLALQTDGPDPLEASYQVKEAGGSFGNEEFFRPNGQPVGDSLSDFTGSATSASDDYDDFFWDLTGFMVQPGETLRLTFQSDTQSVRVDNVALRAIPETVGPTALAGLLLTGVFIRNRRKVSLVEHPTS